MTTVADFYSAQPAEFYRCLKSKGYSGIARYLVADPGSDPRAITPQEVQDAHAAGLEIHFFFEMNPTTPDYFTSANGSRDAHSAIAHLDWLGAPQGSVVYFTIDAPASTIPANAPTLDAYFNAVETVCGTRITPGLYGFQAHVEYARAHYPQIGRYLAQTYGSITGPLDLWQHLQLMECGVEVDENECSTEGWSNMGISADQAKDIVREMLGGLGFPPSPEGNKLVGDAWERSIQKAQLDQKLADEYVKKTDGTPTHHHNATTTVS